MLLCHLYEKPTFNPVIHIKSFYETHNPTRPLQSSGTSVLFLFSPSFIFKSFSFAHLEIVGFSIDLLLTKTGSIALR